jgi:hypothetical protein
MACFECEEELEKHFNLFCSFSSSPSPLLLLLVILLVVLLLLAVLLRSDLWVASGKSG